MDYELDVLPTGLPPRRQPTSPGAPLLQFIISTSASSLLVVLAMKLNVMFQSSPDWTVDVETCTCDCWDRKFKVLVKNPPPRIILMTPNREAITRVGTSMYIFRCPPYVSLQSCTTHTTKFEESIYIG